MASASPVLTGGGALPSRNAFLIHTPAYFLASSFMTFSRNSACMALLSAGANFSCLQADRGMADDDNVAGSGSRSPRGEHQTDDPGKCVSAHAVSFEELEANRVLRQRFVVLLGQSKKYVLLSEVGRVGMGNFELDGGLVVQVEAEAQRAAVVRGAEGLFREIRVALVERGALIANIRQAPMGSVRELRKPGVAPVCARRAVQVLVVKGVRLDDVFPPVGVVHRVRTQ